MSMHVTKIIPRVLLKRQIFCLWKYLNKIEFLSFIKNWLKKIKVKVLAGTFKISWENKNRLWVTFSY